MSMKNIKILKLHKVNWKLSLLKLLRRKIHLKLIRFKVKVKRMRKKQSPLVTTFQSMKSIFQVVNC